MSVDFFDKKYITERSRMEKEFGLLDSDADAKKPAKTTIDKGEAWIATINNKSGKAIQFVPIDNNILLLNSKGGKNQSCDGMLFYETKSDTIYFVELKTGDGDGNWVNTAIKQLQSTVRHFNKNHKNMAFSVKKAYAANSIHPALHIFKATRIQRYKDKTGFELKICHIIDFPG
jgi:hypothetical protein